MAETQDEEKTEILLNRMYVGNFLAQNIGHEAINLVKADNGYNYIYVNPYGIMAQSHNDNIQAILLVRYCGNNTMEVLAKATDLTQLAYVKGKEIKNIIDEYTDIKYGGVPLNEIFGKEQYQKTYITFKADRVRKPKYPIYLKDKTSYSLEKKDTVNKTYYLADYRFAKQSLKMYVTQSDNRQSYKNLRSLIDNTEIWEEENTTKPITDNDTTFKENINFLKIIGKENDELVFSNLFAYFFELDKKAFSKFTDEVLKPKGAPLSENYNIEREKVCLKNENITGYIDLFIEDENSTQAIVIENKIKSGINGIHEREDSTKPISSQLECYYEYITKKYVGYSHNFFIFTSNYNHIDLSAYNQGSAYTVIKYSDIYKWFEDNRKFYKKDKYFEDFLTALKKHTYLVDNSRERELHEKFREAIRNSHA